MSLASVICGFCALVQSLWCFFAPAPLALSSMMKSSGNLSVTAFRNCRKLDSCSRRRTSALSRRHIMQLENEGKQACKTSLRCQQTCLKWLEPVGVVSCVASGCCCLCAVRVHVCGWRPCTFRVLETCAKSSVANSTAATATVSKAPSLLAITLSKKILGSFVTCGETQHTISETSKNKGCQRDPRTKRRKCSESERAQFSQNNQVSPDM